DEIADAAHAGAQPYLAANERQLIDRCLANLGQALGRQRFACDIRHHFREIADAAFGVDDSRFLTAARPEADELHGFSSGWRGSWRQGGAIMRGVAETGKEVRAVVGRMGSGQSVVRKGVSAKALVRRVSVAHRQQTLRYWSNGPFTRRFHLQSEPSA